MKHRAALAVGQITIVDDTGPVQRAQVQMGSLETKDSTPVLSHYGFSSNPPAGADAVICFVAGNRSNGVVVATGHQTFRITGLASGETVIHDNAGKSVYLSANGITVNGGGKNVTITNAPITLIQGDLHVTGDILDQCNAQTETMAGQRALYNSHTHQVLNVQTGGSDVTTQPPTQQET